MIVITLTPQTNAAPAPRVEVLIDGLDPEVATLTLHRTAEGRTFRVRGAVTVPVSIGFQTIDVEAPFQVITTYRAELFDAAGSSLGFTPSASTTLNVDVSWLHNPLDPAGAVPIDIADTSGRALTRPVNGERYYPEQRPLATFITGRRLGLQGVELFLSTDQPSVASAFERMIGDYSTPAIPILVIRTPNFMDIPRTFYAAVMAPTLRPITVHMGGNLREWDAVADEANPPFPGIIIPLLSRDDIDAAFATRDALDANYPTRLSIDRDFSKAGTA